MKPRLLVCLALVAAVAAVYGQTLRFDFVTWDDPTYVTQNAHVRAGLSVEGVVHAFTTGDRENWHPLVTLSHMLDCQLFGLRPAGHHLTNVALHALNALLVFAVFEAMTGALWPSAFVAALFALHPLNVEPVAWVSARKDVLSTFFGLLSTAAWVGWTRRGGLGRYLAAAVFLALGLMAKPMLVTLPAVFLLLDYWPLGRLGVARGGAAPRAGERSLGHLLAEKLPLLALAAASSVVTLAVQQRVWASPAIHRPVALAPRAANAVVSYVRYAGKMLWPADLSVIYPHPNLPGGTPWSAGQVAAAVLVLLAVSAAVLWSRRPWAVVGWLWYLGTLVPVIGIVHASAEAMADRFAYVPLLGLFVIVAWGGAELAARRPRARPALAAVALAVLVASAVRAAGQARYWRDSLVLYERAVLTAPRSAAMQANLANVLEARGRADEAIAHHRLALAADPDYAPSQNNLANLLAARGQLAEALPHYRRAAELAPTLPYVHVNLADALLALGKADEAVAHYRRALALDANHVGAERTRRNLAEAMRAAGAPSHPAPAPPAPLPPSPRVSRKPA